MQVHLRDIYAVGERCIFKNKEKKKYLQNLRMRGYAIKINRIATAVVFGITNLTKDVTLL